MTYVLAIADRSYSSWSLRGWLMFARFDLPVTLAHRRHLHARLPRAARRLRRRPHRSRALRSRRTAADRRSGRRSPSPRRWPSATPTRGFWPADPARRALARTLAAEMHAGFGALRKACPMNLRRAYVGFEPSDAVRADLARIEALWSAARAHAGEGPWLFGA